MFHILNYIIVINISILKAVFTAKVEVLLEAQIKNARCLARCLDVVDTEELKMCLDICHLAQADPGTDICNLPQFCTGPCKAACGHLTNDILPPAISSYAVSKCGVSWEMEKVGQNVVFVVAGLDQGGKWHLVFDDLIRNNLKMSSNGGTKYTKMVIIAVGEGYAVDKMEISMMEHYGVDCEEEKTLADSEEGSSLLLIVLLIVFSLTPSVVLMSSYLYRRNRSLLQSNTLQHV